MQFIPDEPNKPFPQWTVHDFFPFVNAVQYKYTEGGKREVYFEQYWGDEVYSFTLKYSWSNKRDRDILRKTSGLDLKHIEDLHELANVYTHGAFLLNATDENGQSIIVLLDDEVLTDLGIESGSGFGFGDASEETHNEETKKSEKEEA